MPIDFIFIQCQPSQLDVPFYEALASARPGGVHVILYNRSGVERTEIDLELGITPMFPRLNTGYPVSWVNSRWGGLLRLMLCIGRLRPRNVIVQDQTWPEKVAIALLCRLLGARAGMRSDKNALSVNARVGAALWLERTVVRLLFNMLCPVSSLTTSYYEWPMERELKLFPYCTDSRKFLQHSNVQVAREMIRARYRIPEDAVVFLAVAKFVRRENPHGVIEAFSRVASGFPNSWLLLVGAGPDWETEREFVDDSGIPNVCFVGYVPYLELEDYFFASDVLVHLARSEPWGVSPQDALCAGLGLIASKSVGSAVCQLRGDLSRFLVPADDVDGAASRMQEFASGERDREVFREAHNLVRRMFTAVAVAEMWSAGIRREGSLNEGREAWPD